MYHRHLSTAWLAQKQLNKNPLWPQPLFCYVLIHPSCKAFQCASWIWTSLTSLFKIRDTHCMTICTVVTKHLTPSSSLSYMCRVGDSSRFLCRYSVVMFAMWPSPLRPTTIFTSTATTTTRPSGKRWTMFNSLEARSHLFAKNAYFHHNCDQVPCFYLFFLLSTAVKLYYLKHFSKNFTSSLFNWQVSLNPAHLFTALFTLQIILNLLKSITFYFVS